MSEEESPEHRLRKVLTFAGLPKVFYAVKYSALKALPATLQAYSTNANDDLMLTMGLSIHGTKGDVYVYASEEQFRRGRPKLKELPKLKNQKTAPIAVSPLIFMAKVQEFLPGDVHINFGLPGGFSMGGAQLEFMDTLATVVTIAKSQYLYIIQDPDGYAISMEHEDEKYVVGFLKKEDGQATLRGMQQELAGSKLAKNTVQSVVANVQASDINGVILNPASALQCVLKPQEIELLSAAVDVYEPPPIWQVAIDFAKDKLGI